MNQSFFLPDSEEKGEDELPRSNIHTMVDIETLGTHPRAPVLTVGAVLFDPMEQDSFEALWKRAFLRRVTVESSLKACPEVDGGTLAWWLSQEDAAIKELVGENAVSLKAALTAFRQYTHERFASTDTWFFEGHSQMPTSTFLWAKSPDFDCKILENAYEAVGEINKWRFYQYRCVRTIQDLAWPGGPDDRPVFDCGVKHDARADAINQVMTVQAAYAQLGLSKPTVKMDTF